MQYNLRNIYTVSAWNYRREWSLYRRAELEELWISGVKVLHDPSLQDQTNEKIQSKFVDLGDLFTETEYLRRSGINIRELKRQIKSKALQIVKIHGRQFIRDKELAQKVNKAKRKYH